MKRIFTMIAICLSWSLSAQTVTLDYYFNNEYRKNTTGNMTRFHYTWEDEASSGFTVWGSIFKKYGARLNSLDSAPDADKLNGTDIYIIVDPDTRKETAEPHYIAETHISAIANWVEKGGVLVLMANDSSNVELVHFNELAECFGIRFNHDIRNHVNGTQFNMGALTVAGNHPIFTTARKIYLKELCTLGLPGNAKPVLTDGGDVIMAVAKYGRGTVFAVGDPWLYNEYCNGRLTADFDNDKAADDLSKWLLQQIPAKQ